MAKELPYFQFEPAEYLTRDVSFCSLSAQGLFINICAYYWQRECKLTKSQLLRRFNNVDEFNELIQEGVIDLSSDGNDIKVKFLDDQFYKATKLSKINSINGLKGGRPRKKNPIESEIKPKLNPIESESKGIREDKIREDKIREEKIKIKNNNNSSPVITDGFDFDKLLIFINNTFGRKFKVINASTRKKYKSLLKDYTKKDIEIAIINASKNDNHRANGYNYCTPEFFSRPSIIDKYSEINNLVKSTVNTSTSRTSHIHVQEKKTEKDFVDRDNL